MDNGKAGLGALEFGALTGIQTDIYLAAVWIRAADGDDGPGGGDGRHGRGQEGRRSAPAARPEPGKKNSGTKRTGSTPMPSTRTGSLVTELTPWSAVGLAWGLGDLERGLRTLDRMNRADLTTDWGVRMLSRSESPLRTPELQLRRRLAVPYRLGGRGAVRHRLICPRATVLDGQRPAHLRQRPGCLSPSSSRGPRTSGRRKGSRTRASPAPASSFRSSGASSASMASALDRKICFRPGFPADWTSVSISNGRVGEAQYSLEYTRAKDSVTLRIKSGKAEGFGFVFEPAFGLGTEFLAGDPQRVSPPLCRRRNDPPPRPSGPRSNSRSPETTRSS